MSILRKLPIVGKGSYKSNFFVEIDGLDTIVEKAISESGNFSLGTVQLGSLVSAVNVKLNVTTDSIGIKGPGSSFKLCCVN